MPRDPIFFLYVGIKNSVVALDDRTGAEVWATAKRRRDQAAAATAATATVAASS